MTNSNAPRGAQSFNGIISSKFDLRVNKYLVAESDSETLFINDFVKTTGQSDAEGKPIVTKVTSTNDFIVGIVVSFEQDPAANLPIYRKANTKRFVYVCDDPFVKFECQVSAGFSVSDVGKKANLLIGVGNINIGLSTTQLDSTSFTNNDAQIKILRLVDREDNELGTNAKVECTIFKHEAFFFDGVVAGENIFFARQNGDDTQDGKSWEEAFLTASKLMTESAAIASVSTPVTAIIADAGTYNMSLTGVSADVSLIAQDATIIGNFVGIAPNSTLVCKKRTAGFTETNSGGGIAHLECQYANSHPSAVPIMRMQNDTSVHAKIGILEVALATSGIYVNSGTSTENIIYIDTVLLSFNNSIGVNVNAGHATIVIGEILKTGAYTGTTGVKVAAGATADITILGKNEADTPLDVTDHNHNLISTENGILLGGSNPLLSLKGYASTQRPLIHTSFAEGTPASPTTILPTADLGKWTGYGLRQDYATPGEQEYAHIKLTTQVADNEDGRIIIEANDVTTSTITTHNVLDYAAKTGGKLGEFSIPLSVAGLSLPTADGQQGQMLQTNGSKALSFDWPFYVSEVRNKFGTPLSLGTPSPQIPFDTTPPLISDGTQVFSQAFSLKDAAHWLEFILHCRVVTTFLSPTALTAAVFAGSTYIGGAVVTLTALNTATPVNLAFDYAPGTTSSITYSVRMGASTAAWLIVGTTTPNDYQSFKIKETEF